jgi:RNA recognition motif-containing protein
VKRAQARGVAPPSIHQQQYQQPSGPATTESSATAAATTTTTTAAAIGGQNQQQNYYGGGGGTKSPPQNSDLTPEQLHCKVFVGGIPHSVDRDELRRIMSEYGTVTDSIVMLDQLTQRSRGFGFVTFSDATGAERAIAAQPLNVQGRHVEIKLATPRPDRLSAAVGDGTSSVSSTALQSSLGGKPGSHHPNSRFLGLRAGLQQGAAYSSSTASNSEFAGFAVAYGRSGWKAGFGSRAFGRHGWNVQGWDEDDDDNKSKEGGDSHHPAGFSFALLVEGGDSPPAKRRRLSGQG